MITAEPQVLRSPTSPITKPRTGPSKPRAKGKLTQNTEKGVEFAQPPVVPAPVPGDNITQINTEGIPLGRALGEFRSSGQLGRAIGPLLGMSHSLLKT